MELQAALELGEKETITLVGAGGKTSALICLARELAARGKKVIATTTTKMWLGQARLLAEPVCRPEISELVAVVARRLQDCPLVTCGSGIGGEEKLLGIAPEAVSGLASLPVDYVLVEGDGAAGAGLKIPAAHEPVIPKASTLVVTVMGLQVLGRPLEKPWVHRPELAPDLLGGDNPREVTVEAAARLLSHPQGGRKGLPRGARWAVLLNQAEGEEEQQRGRGLAEELLIKGAERVILGAVKTEAPVRQVLLSAARSSGPVGVIVLAAGESRRYGAPKQLLPFKNKLMLQQVVEVALAAGVGEVAVVLGQAAEEVAPVLRGYPVNWAFNPRYREGMSTSLQAGWRALSPSVSGALVVLGDQPGVGPEVLKALRDAYLAQGKKLVAPSYGGKRGNPVLVDRSFEKEINDLRGDQGARILFARYPEEVCLVPVDCPGVIEDIDTPADYRRWVEEYGGGTGASEGN